MTDKTDATNAILPCPFCGWEPPVDDDSLLDVLYPTGTWWAEREFYGSRHITFRNHKEREPDDKPCWGMHCTENMGGCGAKLTALSREEAIAKWNHRQPTASAAMVVVPREPTEAMLDAAREKIKSVTVIIDADPAKGSRLVREPHYHAYKAMLVAHESQNRQVREDSQGLGEPGRLPPNLNELFGNSEKLPAHFPTSKRFTVEQHGDGYAIYQGRDWQHHGLNLGHLTECSPEMIALIERGLNATLAQSPPADTTPDVSEPTDNVEGE